MEGARALELHGCAWVDRILADASRKQNLLLVAARKRFDGRRRIAPRMHFDEYLVTFKSCAASATDIKSRLLCPHTSAVPPENHTSRARTHNHGRVFRSR